VQKCFRATDIEEVGKTTRHLTFFEMLGNFSFGDYYKPDACAWAWELVTEGWGIDVDRLWATVFETDDEAFEIWRDGVGVHPERILRRGTKDNFWSMGVAGPCGPCSEIFVDLGERFGDSSEVGPDGNEDRYLEIWNLVFMQNECNAQIEPVTELPKKNIDTGAGVERLALVLQGVDSIYETDTLGAMVERAGELTRRNYGSDARTDAALRILADHGRSLSFLIADGVLPSNEERGYVLRRVIRRAVRHARLLGREEPVLPDLVEGTIELMGDAYPELVEKQGFIVNVAAGEEERFSATLKQGEAVLQQQMAKSSDSKVLPGDVAFQLHDTFGFPIDLTTEIVSEAGLSVDQAVFEKLMAEQRDRARAARDGSRPEAGEAIWEELAAGMEGVEFLGYEHLSSDGLIVALSNGMKSLDVAGAGDELEVVLDRTPFYAEGGGQVGDRGTIRTSSGEAQVLTTRRMAGLNVHSVKVVRGEIAREDAVESHVDAEWRRGAERAHTATHILHWTLRDRLGEHAHQAGSLVEPGRLRFDFNHFEGLSEDALRDISQEMQGRVFTDDSVRAFETSYDFARSIGAMAIFGEKYGDFVRVVEVGDSKELCGGTHVVHTSQIGVVAVTSEGSVGANLRRIEALVGAEGLRFLEHRSQVLQASAALLKTTPDEVGARIERLLEQQRDMEKRLAEVDRASADTEAEEFAKSSLDVDGTRLVVARRDGEVDAVRQLAQKIKGRLGSSVVVLGTGAEGRANLVAAVSKDLVSRGVSARDLLAAGAPLLGGGAGGKPELAISGGRSSERLQEALDAVGAAARSALQG
jgi:alanyl-tRNA synthetase